MFKDMHPGAGEIFVFYSTDCVMTGMCNPGDVRSVTQTPMTEDGMRQHWKCNVTYYNGDEKEFILPSPGIKIRLSKDEAEEGVRTLKPQLFTGSKTFYT